MSKTVFLFSGQGSQYTGMGDELSAIAPDSNEIFECAGDILGFDLRAALSGTEEALAKTEISQPAIFTVSLLALSAAKERGFEAAAVAGHSLGEYAAMVAADVLTMEDSFRAIKGRSACMARAAAENPGAMAAILGSNDDEINKACAEAGGYVVPVNYNSPQQTVIAGETQAVAQACDILAGMGRKAIRLAVSAAFHSKLMQTAADEFLPLVSALEFKKPRIDFYSNVYGGILPDGENMPEYLAKHIVSPVKFTAELSALYENGFENFIELGPGKVLSGLVKKTLKGVKIANVEDGKSLDKAVELL